jgi:hypothetical protein
MLVRRHCPLQPSPPIRSVLWVDLNIGGSRTVRIDKCRLGVLVLSGRLRRPKITEIVVVSARLLLVGLG